MVPYFTLLQVLLVPYLADLTPGDRLIALDFIKAHWTQSRQYSSPLSTITSFAAALKEVPFLPAAQQAGGNSTNMRSGDNQAREGQDTQAVVSLGVEREWLYKPAELFDPSVPLFAAVMASMAAGLEAGEGGSSVAGQRVLFPAAPFHQDAWLRFLRDLGLQHKVTQDTFLKLAQHVAQQAAGLAQASTAAVTASSSSSGVIGGVRTAAVAATAGSGSGSGYVDVTGADAQPLHTVLVAADALLAHLKSHWTGLGQDRPFWQALGSLPFWPATLGVPGGRKFHPAECLDVADVSSVHACMDDIIWGAGLLQWKDPVAKTTHVSIYTVCGVGVLRLPYIDTTSVFDVADVSSAHACMDDIILRAGLLQWKDPVVKSTPHQQLHRV